MIKKGKQTRIYMDHAAATYLDPRVEKAMKPYWIENYGNPSSLHCEGREARVALENARAKIAEVIGARGEEIIFTNGGTESDNLAIFGVVEAIRSGIGDLPSSRPCLCGQGHSSCLPVDGNHADSDSKKLKSDERKFVPHIITTKIEHHAVLNSCEQLEKLGFDVTYLDVSKEGIVNPEDVKKALRPETILVSIMYANNEIGAIQPIREISKIIRNFRSTKREARNSKQFGFRNSDFGFNEKTPFFHSDACQAGGYLDLNVEKLGVDLMTINGSKIYGPKGIGMLYIKKGTKIAPIIYGGGQEKSLRPGTENVPAIVGLAEALTLAQKTKEEESTRMTKLRDYFIAEILVKIPQTFLNGHSTERLPNNVNVSILGVEGESVLLYLDEAGIACSTGSACTSESLDPSHVILALGKSHAYAHGSIRFSLGKCNIKKDVDYVVKVLEETVKKLRSISAIKF